MKFYVIASFEYKHQARAVIEMMKQHGHMLTFDWTMIPEALSNESRTVSAMADKEGVLDADVVIVLHNDALCNGLVELGMAIATNKLVVVVGPRLSWAERRQSIFYWLPSVLHFFSAEHAVKFLSSEEQCQPTIIK